jgi:hypothetical protein
VKAQDNGPEDRELSDSELDAVLSAADGELLEYLRATAAPGTGLLTIMQTDHSLTAPDGTASRDDLPAPLPGRAACGQDSRLPAFIIEMRSIAGSFARDLCQAIDAADLLMNARARKSPSGRCSSGGYVREPYWNDCSMRSADAPPAVVLRALVEALSDTRRGASAMDRASAGWIADIPELDDFCKALDDFCRAVEGIICRAVEVKISAERDGPRAGTPAQELGSELSYELPVLSRLIPIRWLADVPVDASGADLSRVDIGDPGVLDGVIWTSATVWPPGAAGQVRARSQEIRPGVFQVRGGSKRDLSELVTV